MQAAAPVPLSTPGGLLDDLDDIPLLVIHPERVRAHNRQQNPGQADSAPAVTPVSVERASASPLKGDPPVIAKEYVGVKRPAAAEPLSNGEAPLLANGVKKRKKVEQKQSLPHNFVENGVDEEGQKGKSSPEKIVPPEATLPAGGSSIGKRPPPKGTESAEPVKRSKPKSIAKHQEADAVVKLEAVEEQMVGVEKKKAGKEKEKVRNEKVEKETAEEKAKKKVALKESKKEAEKEKGSAVIVQDSVIVQEEPRAEGSSGSSGGPEGSNAGPPPVRLPTYTHMIKQALAGTVHPHSMYCTVKKEFQSLGGGGG